MAVGAKIFSSRTTNFIVYWLPPLMAMTGILVFSGDLGSGRHTLSLLKWLLSWVVHLPPAQIALLNAYVRKLGHILAYGMLYFLWFRAFQGNLGYSRTKSFFFSLGLCILLALVDEGHQATVQSRGGSLQDLALDTGASSVAALLTFFLWPARPQKAPWQR